jgi:hypothetical protein
MNFLVPVLIAFFISGASTEEFSFANLRTSHYTLPALPHPFLQKGIKKDNYRLAVVDYNERARKRSKIVQQVWKSDASLQGTTSTVILDLVETAGISFEFETVALAPGKPTASMAQSPPSPLWRGGRGVRSHRNHLEVFLPCGPTLGPFALFVDGQELGVLDPWKPMQEEPGWMTLKPTLNLAVGKHQLTIEQRSPQDLPIWLIKFRIR